MILRLEPHGLKFLKVHAPSHFSTSISACSLVIVALLVIEVFPIIIDRGIRNVYYGKFFQRRQIGVWSSSYDSNRDQR